MRNHGHPPLLFEALPPPADASAARQQRLVDELAPLRELPLAAVNVPEVVGGHYETVEPRGFAARLQEAHGVPAVVNRITVHHRAPELAAWVDQTRDDFGIDHVLFVGGESSRHDYPGVGVTHALEALAPRLARRGGSAGVITIPTRRRRGPGGPDEPERLLRKQLAGASFAVSQILLESEHALSLQEDLADACRRRDVPVPPIFWSLAPVRTPRDLDFLRWLGVHVPRGVASRLRVAAGGARREALSREINLTIARELLAHAEEHDYAGIGFCVEHVMQGNVRAAFDLVGELADLVREHPRAAAAAPARGPVPPVSP